MQKTLVSTLTALSLMSTALLSAEAGPLPNETSGAVIKQQKQNAQPSEQVSPPENIIIKNEQQPASVQDQGEKITVRHINFTGDRLVSESKLQELVKPYLEKEIRMADLKQLCAGISRFLQSKDYGVATAYLPKQDIVDGVVNIAIVGGRYGNINIKNKADLTDGIISMETALLKKGEYIRTSSLERTLLLLTDLSGISAKAFLSKGNEIGTSDLNIDINSAEKQVKWQINYDNYGSYNVGPNEVGLTANWYSPFKLGDHIYIRLNTGAINGVVADNNKGLLLGAFNWQVPIGVDGSKLSLGYSKLRYSLGRSFAGLGFDGSANTANLNWIKPLQRSRLANVNLAVGFDNAKLSNMYSTNFEAKQTINRLNIGLSGDNIDASGMNTFNINWVMGNASMDNNAEQIFNEHVIQAGGQYNKVSCNLTREERVSDRLALLMKLDGQFADKNLVSYEKLSLGGPYGVRAYGIGEGSGDDGWLGTAELHWLLPRTKMAQLLAFCDIGKVTINHNSWSGAGENSTCLAGYGLGLSWDRPGQSSVKLAYAWRAGNAPSTIGDSPRTNGRLWLNVAVNL